MSNPIVFYDGDCGMCNGFVQFLLVRDHRQLLRYAPLQGSTAQQLLPPAATQNLDSMAYSEAEMVYYRSTALLRSIGRLGGLWALALVLLLIPTLLRDSIYDFIAKRRKRFAVHCHLLSAEQRALFLP